MLYARAMRNINPNIQVEVWRPERTAKHVYQWQDETQVKHQIFPSLYLRYRIELSQSLLHSVRIARRDPNTVFMVHGIYNLHSYLIAPILKNSVAIGQSHGGLPIKSMFLHSSRRWLRFMYLPMLPLESSSLPCYPHIFTLGSREKNALLKHLAIEESHISISPTGIDFEKFFPGNKGKARDQCGLSQKPKIVLYVGRLSSEKAVNVLITAFMQVLMNNSNASLIIIGEGPREEPLKKLVNRLELDKATQFLGFVPSVDLPDWYRSADVTVLSSDFEGFGRTAVESLACGTPVVITDSGGATDILREFECGLLVPPRNPERMAEAILSVLDENCFPNVERGREAFDWSVILSRLFKIYDDLKKHSQKNK